MYRTASRPEGAKDTVETILATVFILLAAVPLVWLGPKLYRSWADTDVISSQSIGHFIRMSGLGGLGDRVVIETDQGSYPLLHAVAITKGTPLVLQVRPSGQRYICDLPRTLCVKTAREGFSGLGLGAMP